MAVFSCVMVSVAATARLSASALRGGWRAAATVPVADTTTITTITTITTGTRPVRSVVFA